MITRSPCRALSPFIDQFWATSGGCESGAETGRRQLVLPTGSAHLVLRLDSAAVKIYENLESQRTTNYAPAVVGGLRSSRYYKDVLQRSPAVGMQLRPGAVELVSGAPAGELAEKHTDLDLLWPRAMVEQLVERLCHAPAPSARIAIVEAFLLRHVPSGHRVHPAVEHALRRFKANARVGDVVAETGMSHRHFLKAFESTVGLTPKRYLRVRRFNRALVLNGAAPYASWADIAAEAGYADQAHLNREFLAFAGLTPTRYRQLSLVSPHHLQLK